MMATDAAVMVWKVGCAIAPLLASVWMIGCATMPEPMSDDLRAELAEADRTAIGQPADVLPTDEPSESDELAESNQADFLQCIEVGRSVGGRLIEAYVLAHQPEQAAPLRETESREPESAEPASMNDPADATDGPLVDEHRPLVVLIMATIHGNESAGTPLCFYLLDHLREHPHLLENRRVIIVPVANPDGYAADSRTNVREVDLNRNFPSSNFSGRPRHGEVPLSEPESQALYDLIMAEQPDRIISIHQPVKCIDFDGPIEGLAHRWAELTGLPVKQLGARPGSLGSFASVELGIGIITVELPAHAQHEEASVLWERYGSAMIESITYED